ncbi:hypothetical protein KQX54_015157 [Cotesia glomerata]|uniref:Uncharacterized protein n=1 Tax=Cotesia glomerata TaxID=32391 RepID=A0AAV7J554_COTGL|nr:hypothetical protein KQX54_015157 [Cotesia glomerata]
MLSIKREVIEFLEKDQNSRMCPELVQNLEEAPPSFLQHVTTIVHQYQTVSDLKKNLTENSALIHVDFSENYTCRYNVEIQAVHFEAAKPQITLHTGVLYYRDNETIRDQPFCSISENIRHDNMVVWEHLKPVFEWLKDKN